MARGIDRGDAPRRSLHRSIIFLEGFRNLQTNAEFANGQNLNKIMSANLDAELSARAPYQEAVEYCPSVNYPRRDLFEALTADEEGHVDFLETQTSKERGYPIFS